MDMSTTPDEVYEFYLNHMKVLETTL